MLCLILNLYGLSSAAEYRAFELKITNTETGKERMVISTLDHLQYPRYYPLNKNETIAYEDSWRCWENMSDFQPTCPKPDRDMASEATASTKVPSPNAQK